MTRNKRRRGQFVPVPAYLTDAVVPSVSDVHVTIIVHSNASWVTKQGRGRGAVAKTCHLRLSCKCGDAALRQPLGLWVLPAKLVLRGWRVRGSPASHGTPREVAGFRTHAVVALKVQADHLRVLVIVSTQENNIRNMRESGRGHGGGSVKGSKQYQPVPNVCTDGKRYVVDRWDVYGQLFNTLKLVVACSGAVGTLTSEVLTNVTQRPRASCRAVVTVILNVRCASSLVGVAAPKSSDNIQYRWRLTTHGVLYLDILGVGGKFGV